jgi:hypothetical protein
MGARRRCDKPNTGHHHLLIDVNDPSTRTSQFHRIRLIFISALVKLRGLLNCHRASIHQLVLDWSHLPFHPPIMSAVIHVTVK